ncbi:hypothetical protein PF005_g11707 [Phytophthora fragariae]|uniref:Temptin Cys/Cys disulfide domain-containing protein n=1 Tax=Phytophthora fragariae TaxID=53985 RepID=A0A6A3TYG3_9STRA|nr:hypothetical protein PF003_g9609 [Phytophthora fragariae]KAE8937167.1 hypothetical protein PF009_g12926 [Phytophthora fragariae]KAE9110426.1 hypothetical protein PF007_g11869 [Phytophthora fragariae]KAE9110533.1 hypothetical protein PF010_g11137 [Phytophthora fragariae]KAE9144201.1 hypothetical protein PF006_g10842 [Phytophthora fragariae]
MQIQLAVAAAVLTIASTMNSAHGLAKYLNELPNGSSFQQALGHPGDDSSKTSDFAQAFAAAGHTWSKTLCEAKFPGSSMTNGAAFGDPCCTWKKGGKPDFTVTAFTTTPGKATTCAAKGGSSSTSSAAGTSSGASDATKGASDATKGATSASSSTGSSATGAADATKGGATTESSSTGSSASGAANATKGGVTTEISGTGSSATGASETGASATGASAAGASKGSPWGSTPSAPTSGGGCAAKSAKARALRR